MKKIHLVEDNPDNAELIVDLLSDQYEIFLFVSALELLDGINAGSLSAPDIYLLDISLPGMDGVALLKKLHENKNLRKVPSIALTAHAMKDDKRRFLDAGFDGYVSKPIVDEDDLIEEIERLTAG